MAEEEGCGPNCKYRQQPEEWRECKQSKEHEISNHGRVRNKATKRIFRLTLNASYLRACIELKSFRVHRLVAEAFLKHDDEKKVFVNHINGNKRDNHVWNLEYVTPAQNLLHAFATGLRKNKVRAIIQIDKNTGEIMDEFESMKAVLQKNPRFKRGTLSRVLIIMKTAGGYGWRYVYTYH